MYLGSKRFNLKVVGSRQGINLRIVRSFFPNFKTNMGFLTSPKKYSTYKLG